ncbi:hypothetical protein J3E05_001436, partial [Methanococcus voltae]
MSRNTVHFANHLSQDVHIFVSPNKDWVFADFLVDVGTLFIDGYGAVKATKDLWKILRTMKFISDQVSAGLTFTEFFKGVSLKVKPGQVRKIYSTSTSNPLKYLSPSGWAAIFNGKDVTLTVVTDDFQKSVQFNTNSDHSWIAITDEVVRAKYGTLNQEYPKSGRHAWRQTIPEHGNYKGNDTLPADGILGWDQNLASKNGLYELLMQSDGNLVIYDFFRKPLWASNTDGKGGNKLVMQSDGNLVIYKKDNKPI